MTRLDTLSVVQGFGPNSEITPALKFGQLVIGAPGESVCLIADDPVAWRRVAEAATALAEAIERRERTAQQQSDEEAARDDVRYLTEAVKYPCGVPPV